MSTIENNPHLKKKQIQDDFEDQLEGEYDFDTAGDFDVDAELEGDLNLEGETELQKAAQPKPQLNAKNLGAYKNLTGQTLLQNSNVKNMGTLAPGAEFATVTQNPEAQQFILNLKDQGLSNDQIKSLFQSQFGASLSDESILYLTQGPDAFDSGHTLTKYAASYGPLTKQIGIQDSPFAADFLIKMQQDQMTSEAKESLRASKKSAQKDMDAFKKMMVLIQLGLVEKAMTLYASITERQSRETSKSLLKKLIKVSEVRTRLMQTSANLKAPRPSSSPRPEVQARISHATQQYQASVQHLSQTMSMMGEATRESMDLIKEVRENSNRLYELAHEVSSNLGRSMAKTIG